MARTLQRGPAGSLVTLVRDRGPAGALVRVVSAPAPAGPAATGLLMPGGASNDNPVTVPMPANMPTTSLDIRFKGTIQTQTENAKILSSTSGPAEFALFTTGLLQLVWRSTSGYANVTSSVAHGITAGTVASLRATLRSDGGTGLLVDFYKSTDWNPATDAGTWTAIGTQRTSTHPASLNVGSTEFHLGGQSSTASQNLASTVQYLSVRPFGGSEVLAFDPTRVNPTGDRAPNTLTDKVGNIWTLAGSTWSWLTT